MSDPRHAQIHDAFGQTTRIHELAREQKEWHGQQWKVIRAIDKTLRKNLCVKRREYARRTEKRHQTNAAHEKGVGNGHT